MVLCSGRKKWCFLQGRESIRSEKMLTSLRVKNVALINESDVEFAPGLNILTGETGAGKSIIIGSISLALGAKADRDMIRQGAEYGFVELVFRDSWTA